jgi:hypothetical protein
LESFEDVFDFGAADVGRGEVDAVFIHKGEVNFLVSNSGCRVTATRASAFQVSAVWPSAFGFQPSAKHRRR